MIPRSLRDKIPEDISDAIGEAAVKGAEFFIGTDTMTSPVQKVLRSKTADVLAAARNMQMQVQTQPDTIAKQLEAEMVGRTKDEVLQGVSGVLATN